MATPKTPGAGAFMDRLQSILDQPQQKPPASLGSPGDRGPKPAGGGKGTLGSRMSRLTRARKSTSAVA